jgi:hypothetical protein
MSTHFSGNIYTKYIECLALDIMVHICNSSYSGCGERRIEVRGPFSKTRPVQWHTSIIPATPELEVEGSWSETGPDKNSRPYQKQTNRPSALGMRLWVQFPVNIRREKKILNIWTLMLRIRVSLNKLWLSTY